MNGSAKLAAYKKIFNIEKVPCEKDEYLYKISFDPVLVIAVIGVVGVMLRILGVI